MKMTEMQLDALKEIINIGVGKSASALNMILGKRILLKVPFVELISCDDIKHRICSRNKTTLSIVKMPFRGELTGVSELVFPIEGASKMVKTITEDESDKEQLDDQLRINTLSEIGNMILNALNGTIGNALQTRMRYSIPKYYECQPEEIIESIKLQNEITNQVVYAETHFSIVNEDISGSFILFLGVGTLEKIQVMLDAYIKKVNT